MFWILNSLNVTSNPSFCRMRAYCTTNSSNPGGRGAGGRAGQGLQRSWVCTFPGRLLPGRALPRPMLLPCLLHSILPAASRNVWLQAQSGPAHLACSQARVGLALRTSAHLHSPSRQNAGGQAFFLCSLHPTNLLQDLSASQSPQFSLDRQRRLPRPGRTILPEAKMSAVLLGSLMRMITAAKRLGLYSALRACRAMDFKSSLQSRFTVATTFCGAGGGWAAGASCVGRPGGGHK